MCETENKIAKVGPANGTSGFWPLRTLRPKFKVDG